MRRKTSMAHVGNVGINVVRRHTTNNRCFRPLLSSLYVTLKCNLKCSYCDYHQQQYPELDTQGMFNLLEKIRPKSPALDITGGEPLLRGDIVEILKKAKELGFSPLVLNTNALLLHLKEEVLNYVDYVIISLDSMDNDKWDSIINVKGASKLIVENILKYAKLQKKFGFYMTINSVITTKNIGDIYEVINFCKEHNLPVSPVPQNCGIQPDPELVKNPRYKEVIEDIIKMKKEGYPIVASNEFLDMIVKFPKHNCFPTLVPRIFPDGSVFYPCKQLGKKYANLMDYPDLYTMMKEAYEKEGLPQCAIYSNKCYMSCYMEFTNILENPVSVFREHLKNIN